MAPVYHQNWKGNDRWAEDHSAEAVSVMAMEPSRIIRMLLLVLFFLLVVGISWSFIGRLDIMVQSAGIVLPETKEKRVYAPIKGELTNIYVSQGMPVAKGDVIARVYSASAIELASQTANAELALEAAEKKYKDLPKTLETIKIGIQGLTQTLASEERNYQRIVSEGLSKLAQAQALKLEKAQAGLAKAKEELNQAKRILAQHERLFNSPGGGGISGDQVEEKRKSLREKQIDYQLAEVELAEFETALSDETQKKKAEIEKKSRGLLALQGQLKQQLGNLESEREQAEVEVRMARVKARKSNLVQFKDIDDDNHLLIRAPVDGVVTQVTGSQIGSQISPEVPIAAFAAANDRKVLEIKIPERDRAFLKPGMPVKIKLNAFAYQRYGFLNGELEHIAPAAALDPVTKTMMFTARIGLDRDYYLVNKVETPIHYGMGGKAEIMVRKRRIIDLALDPLRNVAG